MATQLQQISATYTLRKICQKIQNKIQQTVKSTTFSIKNTSNQLFISQTQVNLFQNLKSAIIRIVSTQLPIIVNYENLINEKIIDLQQSYSSIQKQFKTMKQNHKSITLQKDTLKVELLELSSKIYEIQNEKCRAEQKYDEMLIMAKKYIVKNQQLQELHMQNQYQKQKQQIKKDDFQRKLQQNFKSYDLPLQVGQKFYKQERLTIPHGTQVEYNNFQLSAQIVGCQKELLEYELKQSSKQIVQLKLKLQQQINYSTKLQKQVQGLERLMEGQKRLKDNLDRQLYLLINNNKQMKIELLQQKSKCAQYQQEITELQEQLKAIEQINTKLQEKLKIYNENNTLKQKMEEELSESKMQLDINQRKYEQLRRLKQQLENKVEEFQGKLQQIQKKQSEEQIKSAQDQLLLKQQNCVKIKQIQQMLTLIKEKYQKKLAILQSSLKQLKQKYKFLKQQNSRLYQCLEVHAKKYMKIQSKYKKSKEQLDSLMLQNVTLKKDKELVEQKLKTQGMLNKQLKRQLNNIEKIKQAVQRKLNKVKISVLPKILYEVKHLRSQKQIIYEQLVGFKGIVEKFKAIAFKQICHMLETMQEERIFKQMNFRLQTKNKQTFIDILNKQNQQLCFQKSQIIQNIHTMQQTNKALSIKLRTFQQQTQQFQVNLQSKSTQIKQIHSQNLKLHEKIESLLQEAQNFIKIQQSSQQQIQIMNSKQKQLQKFYNLIQQLTCENNQLKQVVVNYQRNQQNVDSAYTIYKRKQGQQKIISYTNPNYNNSCFNFNQLVSKKQSYTHLSPVNKLKPSLQRQKNFTHETIPINTKSHLVYNKPNFNKQSSLSQNRPIFYSGTNLNSQQNPNFSVNNEQIGLKSEFQAQKYRLDEIKREYKKIMVDKIRDQHNLIPNNDKRFY